MPKIIQNKHVLIETVAAELAATFYEVGRGQGLKSKWPNARAYARANLEKFIPKATDILISMLGPNSNVSAEMREEIYDALMERHNDPELLKVMPNIDVKRLIELAEMAERKKTPLEIKTKDNVLLNKTKPFRAQRH